jgi:hypothetical protein
MRLDSERSSTYRISAEYRADRPALQLEKRAAPALKAILLGLTRRAVAAAGLLVPAGGEALQRHPRSNDPGGTYTVQGYRQTSFSPPHSQVQSHAGLPRRSRSFNGCQNGWTVQDGLCKPYRGY